MNIYEKLNEARVRFQCEGFQKGGQNGFAHYNYFQLKDILAKTRIICRELKILCQISFDIQIATMTIIDCEKPEDKIVFTSPMSRASLKGCHDVQNLGAVETYIRRYLYMTAFEIEECDPSEDLDNGSVGIGESTTEIKEKKEAEKTPSSTESASAVGAAAPQSIQGRKTIGYYIQNYGGQLQQITCQNGANYLDILMGAEQRNNPDEIRSHLEYLQKNFK